MSLINKVKKIIKYFTDRDYRFLKHAQLGFYNHLSDEEYITRKFKATIGEKPDLNSPKTFNEKLQWLKLYDRKPIYTTMVDKFEVKKYVSDIIGEEYIIPTLGVWDKFDDIDFDSLPNQFVLKCTHDSGGLVICRDKKTLNLKRVRKKIEKSLARNFYYVGREWPYKNVKPRIIAEEFIEDISGHLIDYKFMCYNGVCKNSFVCTDRTNDLKVTFFDRDWKVMPFERHYPKSHERIECPVNYEKMISLAEKLSRNIPFIRVDFYEVDKRVYFGELTFFPGGGFEKFEPEEWDYKFGSYIKLPEK